MILSDGTGLVPFHLLIVSRSRPRCEYLGHHVNNQGVACWPSPFRHCHQNGLFGVAVDLARALVDKLGLPMPFLYFGYDERYDDLATGQADICTAFKLGLSL